MLLLLFYLCCVLINCIICISCILLICIEITINSLNIIITMRWLCAVFIPVVWFTNSDNIHPSRHTHTHSVARSWSTRTSINSVFIIIIFNGSFYYYYYFMSTKKVRISYILLWLKKRSH